VICRGEARRLSCGLGEYHASNRAGSVPLASGSGGISSRTGSPNFRVRGKTFATYVVNHHGDRRVALWLPAAPGAQEHHVGADPDNFFVASLRRPPRVARRPDRPGIFPGRRIVAAVREAYERVAPAGALRADRQGAHPKSPRKLATSDVDPCNRRAAGKSSR